MSTGILCPLIMCFISSALSASLLGPGVGMGGRPKRRPSESDHRVTIDLSALRPSLPGLVLYKYGDLAPKLVQVDLSALNPRIQPHVIWPQFNEMEFDESPFSFEAGAGGDDAIPYLTEGEMSPRKMARMTEEWMRGSGADMYDFVQGDDTSLLHGSLPLADEVIVPLDWEEGEAKKKQKKNVFLTRGWRAGGERGSGTAQHKQQSTYQKPGKAGISSNFNGYYSRTSIPKPSQSWSIPRRRETESENFQRSTSRAKPGKKDSAVLDDSAQPVRLPSQESWSVPRQYWNVPHLFVNNWQ